MTTQASTGDMQAAPVPTTGTAWLTPRVSFWTGMALWVIGLGLSAAGVVLLGLNQATLASQPKIVMYPIWLTSGLPYLILGGLIVARRPSNRIGWVLSVGGLAGVVCFTAEQYGIYSLLTRPEGQFLAPEAAWLAGSFWFVWLAAPPCFILLFPDGKPPSPRWRWVVRLYWPVIALLLLPGAVGFWGVRNTYLFEPSVVPAWVNDLFAATFVPFYLVSALTSLAAIVSRYRAARGVERLQIRWLIYAVLLLVALNELSDSLLANTPLRGDATALVSSTSVEFLILPICIGVAIFRYHLFEIDRLINRTIVYGLLTLILVGLYLGGVALLQSLLNPFTGGGNDLAVVATTLVIAALFLPLRRGLQEIIDRRFYRRKYDAARTLAAFGQVARDEVHLDKLTGRLVTVVEETLQPEHMSLWLSPQRATTKQEVLR